MSATAGIQALLTKCEAACITAALDDGLPEDLLSEPRHLLVRAIKAVDAFRLGPDPTGIALIGSIQTSLNGLLANLDRCLPRTSIETDMTVARPVLATIVSAIPQLLGDVKGLDAFASPLAIWG